ncbi:MAG: glycosyltransferase [Methanobacterium sp.]|nr:glycosyltransferase [Methanobacterium sp.]
MNICLLGHFPPHIGGVSSHSYLLSQELVKRGDKVFVLTYPIAGIRDINGIHVESAPTINIKGLRGFIFSITATIKLFFMIRKYNIDLIHAHFIIPPGLVAVLVAFFTKKEVAVTVHGSDIFILASNPVLRILIRFVLRKADYVVVVNESIQNKILKLNIAGIKDKIKITANAVDLEKFKPDTKTKFTQELDLDPNKPMILFVGNLVSQKGLKYLIEAKNQLQTDAEMVIVGDGPLMDELTEIVKNKSVSDVYFIGARRDVHLIMPAADLFVLPSISEGFPITLLEAFACGLPAVATDVGGIKELVTKEVGIVVKPEDVKSLAEAMDEILQNHNKKLSMGKSARKRAEEYGNLNIPY